MAFLGEMVVKITGDNKEFDKSVDDSKKKTEELEEQTEKTGKKVGLLGRIFQSVGKKAKAFGTTIGKLVNRSSKAGEALNKFGNSARKVGAKITTRVTLPLVAAAIALTKVASDAEETESKFATVFQSISATSEKAASDLATNFGLSSTKAKLLLSDTGDLLSGFGFTGAAALDLSVQVNELAVDLASFTNFSGGAEGASAALTKALLGERESLKSLGIAITEADIKQLAEDKGIVGALDRQTKAALTLEIAVSQSKNAIGDFARTQDGLANQVRILQADFQSLIVSLGKELIPIAKDLVTFIRGLIKDFSGLSDGAKRTILIIAGVTATIGPLISIIGALSTALAFLAANPIILALAGIIALTAGIIALNAQIEKNQIENEFKGVAKQVDTATESAEEFRKKVHEISEETGFTVTQVIEIAEEQGVITEELKEQAKILKANDKEINKTAKSIKEVVKDQERNRTTVKLIFDEYQDINVEVERISDVLQISQVKVAAILLEESRVTTEKKKQLEIIKDQLQRQIRISKSLRSEEVEIAEAKREARRARSNKLRKKTVELSEEEKKLRKEINDIYDELNEKFSTVNTNVRLYGDEIDAAKEKQDAIKESVEQFIELGLSPQSKIVQNLIAQYKELGKVTKSATAQQEKDVKNLSDVMDKSFADAADKREEQTKEELEEQKKRFEEQVSELVPVLTSVSQVFASTLVESGGNAWLAFKEAGKEAIATVIESLGQQAATLAAISFVPGPTFNPIAGAGYLTAATGAFVAAGLVRALADGGVVTQPTFAQIGENGREAVLPLDKPNIMRNLGKQIASNISSPVNNIFQPENNISFPNEMMLNVDGQQLRAFITKSSKNGQIQISQKRGVVK